MAVLRDLLRYAAQLPTLFRDISTNHLPGLLTSLLGLRPEVRALTALTLCGARVRGAGGVGGSGQWGGERGEWGCAGGVWVGTLGSLARPHFLFCPQCELSAMEGMKACMTYFPRACGSLKVSDRAQRGGCLTADRRVASGRVAECSEQL